MTEEEINRLQLEEKDIPEWVFDVHTIKGKYKLHKTDLDMTIDEENALRPHQYSLFDYGAWDEYYEPNRFPKREQHPCNKTQ